jgi:ABC-2 type transport system permease protein
MFSKILQFELRYWLRQPMVYVFTLIVALLVFGSVGSDDVTIGSSFSNIKKNAPFVILSLYAFMSLLVLLMVTAFAQSSALRDFNHDTHQIIFSTPVRKFPYLAGRFTGAFLVALIPLLGTTLGILTGGAMPWLDPERVAPVHWPAHLQGFVIFGITNTFFITVVIFTIAALTRSTIASFVGAIAMLVGYALAGTLLQDIDNEQLGMLIDPFGIGTFSTVTKYWTVADKNTTIMEWGGMMMLNRLLWMGAAALILVFTYWRFDFSIDRGRLKKKKKETATAGEDLTAVPAVLGGLPKARLSQNIRLYWRQMFNQARIDFLGIVKNLPFIIITLFGIANMTGSMINATSFYGLTTHPVTYNMVGIIRGTMYLFTFGILVFYSGELVWKERNANVDQIYDALPHPNWVTTVSKILAMMGVLAVLQILGIITGVIAQAAFGYTNFELDVYLKELLVLDLLGFLFMVVVSMLIHTVVNNKYIGYFAFVVLFILNIFIWDPLEIQSVMVRFGQLPSYTYSDMNGFGPFVPQLFWFNLYWLFFAALLAMGAVLLWVRGKDNALRTRFRYARHLFGGSRRYLSFAFAGLWLAVAGFVFYNTQMLNPYDSTKVLERRQVEYEKKYKEAYEDMRQPILTDIDYKIDIYPGERNLFVEGEAILVNKGKQPIDTLFINTFSRQELKIEIERGNLVRADENLQVQFYHLNPALQPGDSIWAAFTTRYISKGFENEVSFTQVVPNGTFFNNQDITPLIGYQPSREMTDKNDRKKYGLPERQPLPTLTRNCTDQCMHNYLSNFTNWVNTETVISTAPGQVAVAPGSLIDEWEENGRRYFRYRLDHKSLGFYSFISADYEVIREKWNGIDVEVYYHEAHPYNVDKMVNSIKKSLDYYTRNFSPYRHGQARIIEFPRYASFAQAFPGTMPYSESIGFIARIEDEGDIDMVFYVVAHEMAHQWWGHQAMGAAMEGATLLVETLAQYSAIMVMEKEYGKDQIHKFLKYEMDNYLRSRGAETRKEKPLMRVDANQGYIHYRKGSCVMYYLKEMIGEDSLNAALRDYLDAYAYAEPPYPTAYALVDRLRERTPDSLQYLITDLFEEITLFDNRVIGDPQVEELDNGQFKVTLEVECTKLRADSLGAEHPIAITDYIDFGVYAEPEGDKERGKTLALERHCITEPKQTLTFVVDEKPYEAGVDPNYYLIDRMPEDNVKRVRGL